MRGQVHLNQVAGNLGRMGCRAHRKFFLPTSDRMDVSM